MRREALYTVKMANKVSIHASVKDATSVTVPLKSMQSCFNPRICKRCDFEVPDYDVIQDTVSIHASVKDATTMAIICVCSLWFQSTHL